MFTTAELCAACCQAEATYSGSASPQNKLYRRLGRLRGFKAAPFIKALATEGTESHTLTPFLLMKFTGLEISCGRIVIAQAPLSHAINGPNIERSKVESKVSAKTSSRPKSYRRMPEFM